MKKIFINLMLMICLAIAAMCGGCANGSSNQNNKEQDEGDKEVETITTLEGTWMSDYYKTGGYSKAIIKGTSIRLYNNYNNIDGLDDEDVLYWVGIYVPFTEPISEGAWIFENDGTCEEERPNYYSKEFTYSDKKLSCNMVDILGDYVTMYFIKVSD